MEARYGDAQNVNTNTRRTPTCSDTSRKSILSFAIIV